MMKQKGDLSCVSFTGVYEDRPKKKSEEFLYYISSALKIAHMCNKSISIMSTNSFILY